MNITHQNITEQIVNYFEQKIESGEWKVGEKIPSENQLTQMLGVSRASVRSAMNQLIGIGVLESVHGKGTYLLDDQIEDNLGGNSRITAEDCRDVLKVLEFRRIVESEACYMATLYQSDDLIVDLKKCLKTMIESKDDIEKFVIADIKFHHKICKASQNPLLEKCMYRVFEENKKSQQLTRKTFGFRDGIIYHEKIIEAIEAGDARLARHYMYQHLQNGIDRVVEQQKET